MLTSSLLVHGTLSLETYQFSLAFPRLNFVARREAPSESPRRVFISGQKRGVFGVIKREFRRRSAVEPVIGHMKTDGRRDLKEREGDAANIILSAIGHNFRLVLAWLRVLLRPILLALSRALALAPAFRWAY
jgi:IS5 family transposase